MNNLKKNHRLIVVLLSFLSGTVIFPPLVLAQPRQTIYSGYVTYEIHQILILGKTQKLILLDSGAVGAARSSESEVGEALAAKMQAVVASLKANQIIIARPMIIRRISSLSQSLIASRTNPVHLIASATEPELNSKRLEDAVNSVEANTEELLRVTEPLFSPEGFQLNQINTINVSVKRTKESLLVLLEELNSIPDNQPDEVLIAKKEMLNSINDLTSILSDVSEITKAYNKAISESE
jgi:hypothetical protein